MKLRYRGAAIALILFFIIILGASLMLTHNARAASASSPAEEAQAMDVRWGFYVTYNPNSLASLQANARSLNYVSSWFFNVNSAAQITGQDRPEVSALLTSVGAKNLPLLKNSATYNDFTAILTDTTKQLSIINQIDVLVQANNYDGITIDFEGVNATDKAALTAFMGRLYNRLHSEGKLVAMAVPAKLKDVSSGWGAPYDYAALAAVNDYLLIMAYDYHWSTSDPGAVAPIAKLRDTAAYTLALVPAKKVVWGIGVYGYDWQTDGTGRTVGKAEYRTYTEAAALAAQPGAESGYDEQNEAPWVRYTRDGYERNLWYEDSRSFAAKLDLISQQGMAGFGIWRLGQEDPQLWQILQKPKLQQTPTACKPVTEFASTPDKVFFQQTGHSLGGVFLQYWQEHGGLPVYGYPLTEEYTEKSATDGKSYTVQYFERNRFEYHPENQPPQDVQMGLLGVQAIGKRIFPPLTDPMPGSDTIYFPQVQHTIGGAFLQYWQERGGVGQFGYPISEPVLEKSAVDGQTYTVQYMERARFELHPEYKGSDAEVLLGLLGRDVVPCK